MEGDAGPPGLSGEPGKQGFRVSLFYFTSNNISPYQAFFLDADLMMDEEHSRSIAKVRDISVCCTKCLYS